MSAETDAAVHQRGQLVQANTAGRRRWCGRFVSGARPGSTAGFWGRRAPGCKAAQISAANCADWRTAKVGRRGGGEAAHMYGRPTALIKCSCRPTAVRAATTAAGDQVCQGAALTQNMGVDGGANFSSVCVRACVRKTISLTTKSYSLRTQGDATNTRTILEICKCTMSIERRSQSQQRSHF